jgi:hypothetical protein
MGVTEQRRSDTHKPGVSLLHVVCDVTAALSNFCETEQQPWIAQAARLQTLCQQALKAFFKNEAEKGEAAAQQVNDQKDVVSARQLQEHGACIQPHSLAIGS